MPQWADHMFVRAALGILSAQGVSAIRLGAAAVTRLTLSPKEAAGTIGVCENTFRTWMREEGLPYYRIRGKILIRVDELLEWIGKHQETPGRATARVDEIISGLRVVER